MRFFPELLPVAAVCGAMLLAGCGGGDSGTINTARVRTLNAIPNGGSATFSLNGSAVGGSQAFAAASTYQYDGSGASAATVSLSGTPGTVYPSVSQTFVVGNFYSFIAIGRSDVTTTSDPRYPALLVTSDTLTSPLNNQASVRIIQAAPDAGSVDVLVNNAAVTSGAAYKSVSGYTNISAGTATIQVNQAGTNTVLAGPQSLPVTAGHVYTVLVEEPTVAPAPSYGIQGLDDTSSL